MSDTPSFSGHCYCGALSYSATAKPVFKAQCHCRECQYFSGGGPNYFMLLPEKSFEWRTGTPAQFTHPAPDNPVTRSFCGTCGTHICTHLPYGENLVLKVGTLDDPSLYGGPKAVIHAADKQPFHLFPDSTPVFDNLPPR